MFQKDSKKDRVELVLKGLDLDAEIFLNGIKITEHYNAFIPCMVNVTECIKEGDNELIVKLDVGKKESKRQTSSEKTIPQGDILK